MTFVFSNPSKIWWSAKCYLEMAASHMMLIWQNGNMSHDLFKSTYVYIFTSSKLTFFKIDFFYRFLTKSNKMDLQILRRRMFT